MKKYILFTLSFALHLSLLAQPKPFVNGSLPIQAGKKLVFNSAMSDEFDGRSLNRNKWETGSPTSPGWKGRFPGLFQDSAVSVKQGKLWIKASAQRTWFQGRTWTHQGGLVRSLNTGLYGYYECKMKANQTIMSSTFWLNSKCDGTRSTELDITEVVGEGDKPWITNNNMRSMNFNTHHWLTCQRSPETDFAEGGHARLAGNALAYQDYHVYGAFWKSKDLVIFYLDGKEVGRITPRSDFNLRMHMMMVVETYNWNPPNPGKDGMNRSVDARSTTYEYVRAWTIENDNTPSTQALSNGTYYLNSVSNNQRMIDKRQEDNVRMHNPGPWNDQQWIVKHLGNDVYTFQNVGTQRFLEVPFAKCADNTNVNTWTAANSNHHRWKVIKHGNQFELKPNHCLTQALDRNFGAQDANVQTYQALGNANQRWSITTVTNARTTSNQVQMSNDVIGYPNPVTNQLQLKNLQVGQEVVIRDQANNIVLRTTIQNSNELLNISHLKPGIYLLHTGTQALKIVKK